MRRRHRDDEAPEFDGDISRIFDPLLFSKKKKIFRPANPSLRTALNDVANLKETPDGFTYEGHPVTDEKAYKLISKLKTAMLRSTKRLPESQIDRQYQFLPRYRMSEFNQINFMDQLDEVEKYWKSLPVDENQKIVLRLINQLRYYFSNYDDFIATATKDLKDVYKTEELNPAHNLQINMALHLSVKEGQIFILWIRALARYLQIDIDAFPYAPFAIFPKDQLKAYTLPEITWAPFYNRTFQYLQSLAEDRAKADKHEIGEIYVQNFMPSHHNFLPEITLRERLNNGMNVFYEKGYYATGTSDALIGLEEIWMRKVLEKRPLDVSQCLLMYIGEWVNEVEISLKPEIKRLISYIYTEGTGFVTVLAERLFKNDKDELVKHPFYPEIYLKLINECATSGPNDKKIFWKYDNKKKHFSTNIYDPVTGEYKEAYDVILYNHDSTDFWDLVAKSNLNGKSPVIIDDIILKEASGHGLTLVLDKQTSGEWRGNIYDSAYWITVRDEQKNGYPLLKNIAVKVEKDRINDCVYLIPLTATSLLTTTIAGLNKTVQLNLDQKENLEAWRKIPYYARYGKMKNVEYISLAIQDDDSCATWSSYFQFYYSLINRDPKNLNLLPLADPEISIEIPSFRREDGQLFYEPEEITLVGRYFKDFMRYIFLTRDKIQGAGFGSTTTTNQSYKKLLPPPPPLSKKIKYPSI